MMTNYQVDMNVKHSPNNITENGGYPMTEEVYTYDVYGNGTSDEGGYGIDDETFKTFGSTTEAIIITVFSVLIIFGAIGNGLVCFVVFRNSHMRTPRNIFIINLAISDLTLCLFTQPLNLYKLLNSQWHLGAFVCKLSAMLQGTNVFVSTISITAIALDRFQVIVYPTKDSMKKIGGAAALVTIWIISLLMASPLIIFSVYKEEQFQFPEFHFILYYCLEDVTLRAEKGAYSVASMVVQYILPVMTVSVAHARICNKLKYRMVNRRIPRSSGPEVHSPPIAGNRSRSSENRAARKRKTNILLAFIAIVFVFSWMPLNISNILVEFQFHIFKNKAIDINLVFVVCHMLVLSSACTNPVLYGWLNDNFRKEFIKVLQCSCCNVLKRDCSCLRRHRDRGIPVITFSPDENGGNVNGVRGSGRRPTNTSHMFMTTEIEQSCPASAVSL